MIISGPISENYLMLNERSYNAHQLAEDLD